MAIGSLSPVCSCESLVWVSETEIVAPAYNPIPNHPAKDNSEKEHPRLFHPAPNLCINGFCCEISKTIDRVSPDRFCTAFPILNIERAAGGKTGTIQKSIVCTQYNWFVITEAKNMIFLFLTCFSAIF